MGSNKFRIGCLLASIFLSAAHANAGGIEGTYDNGYLGDTGSCPSLNVSDPVNIMTGNLFHKEPVYRDSGSFPLEFNFYYNSRFKDGSKYGGRWSSSYGQLVFVDSASSFSAYLSVLNEDGSLSVSPPVRNPDPTFYELKNYYPTGVGLFEFKHDLKNLSQQIVRPNIKEPVGRWTATYNLDCKGNQNCAMSSFKSLKRIRDDGVTEYYDFVRNPSGSIKVIGGNINSAGPSAAPDAITGLLTKLESVEGETQTITRVYADASVGALNRMEILHSNGRKIILSSPTSSSDSWRHYVYDKRFAQFYFNKLTVGASAWSFNVGSFSPFLYAINKMDSNGSLLPGVAFRYNNRPQTTTAADWDALSSLSDYYVNRTVTDYGNHIAGWVYDDAGRVIKSYHGATAAFGAYNTFPSSDMTLADSFSDPLTSALENYTHHDRRSITNMLTQQKTTYQFQRQNYGDPLESNKTYARAPLVGISGAPSTNCAASGTTFSYSPGEVQYGTDDNADLPGFKTQQLDAKGFITKFRYHNSLEKRGRISTVTTAAGTQEESITKYNWKPDAPNLLTKLEKPGLTTEISYTAKNRLLDITQTDTTNNSFPYSTNGLKRTWHYDYTYYDVANIKVKTKTITAPGNKLAITESYDALGHLINVERKDIPRNWTYNTTYSNFNDWGLPQTVVGENGLTTKLEYLTTAHKVFVSKVTRVNSDASNTIWSFEYNLALEQLTKISYPDGRWLKIDFAQYSGVYTTDISSIENNIGEKITYGILRNTSPDASLKTITQSYLAATGGVTFKSVQTFDALDRLYKEVRGTQTGSKTSIEENYDVNNNIQFFKQFGLDQNGTPLTLTSEFGYNSQNQLKSAGVPDAGTTASQFDTAFNTNKITDANLRVTDYVYNGFGQVVSQKSPGTAVFWYDDAGNVSKSIRGYNGDDAQEIQYRYDGFNHITNVMYMGGNFGSYKDEQYSYDVEWDPDTGSLFNNPLASDRLTRVVKGGFSGPASKDHQVSMYYYYYDDAGNVKSEKSKIGRNAPTKTISYDISKTTEQLTYLTYPSGLKLKFGYDLLSRVTQIDATAAGGTLKNIINGLDYYPFGPAKTIKYGNGIVETRTLNDAYLIDYIDISSGLLIMDYVYTKGFGNIDSIKHAAASDDENFVYDKSSRLKSASRAAAYGTNGYAWNLIGDRTTQTLFGITQAITPSTLPTGNEIKIPAQGKRYGFDLRGNLIDDTIDNTNDVLYGYGPDNELLGAVNPKTKRAEIYCYNFKQERICKDRYPEKTRTIYHYSVSGKLLSEFTSGIWRDYVYLGDKLIALVDTNSATPSVNTVYYVNNNHLPAPVLITDQNKTIVWQAKYDPFGNVSLVKQTIKNNVRFPGQYYDDISGLHYNHYRHYHPGLGRYVQSDPIGLDGGVNTYGYVGGNPVNDVDPQGLAAYQNYIDPSAEGVLYNWAEGSFKNKNKEVKNFNVVIAHGNGSSEKNVVQDFKSNIHQIGGWTPEIVATLLKNDKNYDPSKPVLLISCSSGVGGKYSLAQRLANALGNRVVAPLEVLEVYGTTTQIKEGNVMNGGFPRSEKTKKPPLYELFSPAK
jgi:RHS repeat-associated protein